MASLGRERFSRAILVAGIVSTVGLVSARATAADRVAVLRFTAAGGETTTTQLDSARAETRAAVGLVHDVLPSDAELKAAEAAVKDGVPDTSDEYRAAGRIASAQWTVAAHVDAHGWTYRLELEACQVGTGRVESLAREVDARQAAAQIAEMLALLLRPQGVGDTVPPWDQAAPAPSSTPVAPKAPAVPPPAPPSSEIAPLPSAYASTAAPPQVPPAYGAEHPFAAGLGVEVLSAFVRGSGARGSATAGIFTATALYAIASVPGLELVGDVGAGAVGPTSLRVDVGARYLLSLVPSHHFLVGGEAGLGGFFVFGGDKDPRFLVRGAIPLVWSPSTSVQVEAYPELAGALGGTVSLGFVGGGARVVLRF